MAKLVLRPSSVDGLGYYNSAWAVFPAMAYADAIDDVIADGDASYVAAVVPDAAFTTRISTSSSASWPRPYRIRSLMVLATVRRLGADAALWKFRIRYGGINYDSSVQSVNVGAYREFYWLLPNNLSGAGWSFSSLRDAEVGLVYLSGGTELRCTKMEIQVQTELMPDFRLEPAGPGTFNAWARNVPTLPAERMVNGAFDGDLSRLQSVTPGDSSSFAVGPIPPLTGYNIDRVQVKAAVRTTDEAAAAAAAPLLVVGGVPYRDGTNQLYQGVNPDAYPSERAWAVVEAEYLNSPSTGWPSGLPAATAWTDLELAAAEIGVENGSAVPVRCTSLALDVFLKRPLLASADAFPVANSAWHVGLPPLVPNGGEQAWEDVDEDPPDDAASYVGATATGGEPIYGAFQFAPAPVPVPGRQIYALELRSRCTLGATASAVVAHVVTDRLTGETYIGKSFVLSAVAGTWFDLKEDLFTNPLTTSRWLDNAVTLYDFGWAILAGEAYLSRLRVQYQYLPSYNVAVPDPVDFQLTNEALLWIAKSKLDGSVYEIDTFAVGSGGFNPVVPSTVLPVNPADTALAAEVKRFRIRKVTYSSSTLPGISWTVTYYCRVPRDQLLGNTVGEVGLFARVLWSPLPAEVGYQFLFALAHFPGQVCVLDDTYLIPATVNYP